MEKWHNIHITDKTGGKFFDTTASPMSTASEIRNLQRHIKQAEKAPWRYLFLDVPSIKLIVDGEPYGDIDSILDDDLLNLLNS